MLDGWGRNNREGRDVGCGGVWMLEEEVAKRTAKVEGLEDRVGITVRGWFDSKSAGAA